MGIYIYDTVLRYQYIPYASVSHISSLRVATAAGQWESMTATPRDLRQNMVSWGESQFWKLEFFRKPKGESHIT